MECPEFALTQFPGWNSVLPADSKTAADKKIDSAQHLSLSLNLRGKLVANHFTAARVMMRSPRSASSVARPPTGKVAL